LLLFHLFLFLRFLFFFSFLLIFFFVFFFFLCLKCCHCTELLSAPMDIHEREGRRLFSVKWLMNILWNV
jgi:hypothetical protein